MFLSYWTTAVRSLRQHKQHFILNVLGLSIGFGAAILVAMFTINEMSYDTQHPNATSVYRITQDYSKLGLMVLPLFNYHQAQRAMAYTQVEDFFSLTSVQDIGEIPNNVTLNGKGYKLNNLYGASNNIKDFVHLPIVSGDIVKALSTPNNLALSRSEALRIFGDTNIIGKTLTHKNGLYTVAAVFENLPENTHFIFQNLTFVEHDSSRIYVNNSYIYLRLTSDNNIPALEKTLTDLYFDGQLKGKVTLELEPLLDIHLLAKSAFEMKTGGTNQVVLICAALSVLLIVIASVNFINMSIAQSAKRAKEVGVRKALGAHKGQIISQFLCESLLLALFSLLIAYILVELTLPSFNALIDRQLLLDYNSTFTLVTLVITLAVSVLAGLYPALFISSFSAKRVLSGDLQRGKTAVWVRKGLLVIQAALSVALIIAAVVLHQQLTFLQNMPLGYEIKNRLVISGLPKAEVLTKENNTLISQISAIAGVQQITQLDTQLTVSVSNTIKPTWPNGESSEQLTPIIGVGYGVVKSLGLTLLAGRDFSQKFSSDWFTKNDNITRVAAIITESVARESGYNNYQDVIGKTLVSNSLRLHVVGVVSDVKVGNSKSANMNVMFLCGLSFNPLVDVLLTAEPRDLIKIKHQLNKVLSKSFNIYEPKIHLLSDNYKHSLIRDKRIADVVTLFSGLAIFLTCLGTFGLSSFSTLCRQKEVAMRKVLGATRFSLVNLLAKEFLLLVLVSITIAFPLTFWLVNDWLSNFNDRIDQSLWVYLLSALGVATITWLTVASLAFKMACTRPSLILHHE